MVDQKSIIEIGETFLKQSTILHQGASDDSESLAMLNVGDLVKLGKIKKHGGKTWVSVSTVDGKSGYISNDTKVFTVQRAELLQDSANVYADSLENSSILFSLKKNSRFTLVDVVDNWIRIRDNSGNEGFISSQTKIKKMSHVTKEMGKRNMLYGGLWFLGGSILTIGGLSAATTSGGTYYIFWGAIVFGLIQFFTGVSQYSSAGGETTNKVIYNPQPKNMWKFKTHEVLFSALGAVLYAILSLVTNWIQLLSSAGNVWFFPAVVIPMFFGIVFGPIVGFISGFLGNIISELLGGYGVFFWWDLGYGLVGLITGLIFLRMTNYKSFKDIMWAELFSLIGIIVGLGLASISEIWVSGADISTILSTIFIPTAGTNAINGFILLPILMIVYAAIAQLSGR